MLYKINELGAFGCAIFVKCYTCRKGKNGAIPHILSLCQVMESGINFQIT